MIGFPSLNRQLVASSVLMETQLPQRESGLIQNGVRMCTFLVVPTRVTSSFATRFGLSLNSGPYLLNSSSLKEEATGPICSPEIYSAALGSQSLHQCSMIWSRRSFRSRSLRSTTAKISTRCPAKQYTTRKSSDRSLSRGGRMPRRILIPDFPRGRGSFSSPRMRSRI